VSGRADTVIVVRLCCTTGFLDLGWIPFDQRVGASLGTVIGTAADAA